MARVTWTGGTFFKMERTRGRFELRSASQLFCLSEEREAETASSLSMTFLCLSLKFLSRNTYGFESFLWKSCFRLVSWACLPPVPGESRRWQPADYAGKARSSAAAVALCTNKSILSWLGRKKFCFLLVKAVTEGLRSKEPTCASYYAPGQHNIFCSESTIKGVISGYLLKVNKANVKVFKWSFISKCFLWEKRKSVGLIMLGIKVWDIGGRPGSADALQNRKKPLILVLTGWEFHGQWTRREYIVPRMNLLPGFSLFES